MEGFVQQLAVAYVARGYYFYVTGFVPEGKDPARVTPSSAPATGSGYRSGRGHGAGPPGRRATPTSGTAGSSCSWPRTARARSSSRRPGRVRDARRTPIRFSGYAISHRGGHVHVRIDRPAYLGLKAYLVGIAPHRDEADWRPRSGAARLRAVRAGPLAMPGDPPRGQPGACGGRAARGAAVVPQDEEAGRPAVRAAGRRRSRLARWPRQDGVAPAEVDRHLGRYARLRQGERVPRAVGRDEPC